jgi:hypothetical protein
MELRRYPPGCVARAILRAVKTDPALLPLTPEARVVLRMSQVSPGILRRLARIDPGLALR